MTEGLTVRDLSVAYGAHRALEGVSVDVAPGEIAVILGANGAGKSTLLKAIAGTVKAQPGARIAIAGRDIAGMKAHRIVNEGIALVPEGRGIFGDLTVAENLQLGAYGKQARQGEANRLGDVLALFPRLAERRGQITRTMSGGEQQMVAIGRALMSNPTILMLDEPSLGLSPLLTRDLFRSLKAVRDKGVGILLVEQNARQSLAIADRGYLLENGRIVGQGNAANLARDPAVQAAYLGGAAATSQESRHAPAPVFAPLPPMPAATGSADVAVLLAQRASAIQRRHLEALRGRAVEAAGRVNGRPCEPQATQAGAPDIRGGARELSARAADMAARARAIQSGHLAETRSRDSIWTILSPSRAIGEGDHRK